MVQVNQLTATCPGPDPKVLLSDPQKQVTHETHRHVTRLSLSGMLTPMGCKDRSFYANMRPMWESCEDWNRPSVVSPAAQREQLYLGTLCLLHSHPVTTLHSVSACHFLEDTIQAEPYNMWPPPLACCQGCLPFKANVPLSTHCIFCVCVPSPWVDT